jgi:hypothetical protein
MASKGVAMAGKAMKKGVQVGQRALSDTMKASEIKRPQFEMQSIHDLAGETKAQDAAAADTIAIKKVRDRIVAQNTAHAKAKATEHAHEQAQIKADEAMTKTVAERNKAKNELADKAKRAEKAKSRAKSEALRLHEATVEAKNAADDAATKKVRERMIAKNAHEAKAAKIKAAEHDPHDWEGQIEHTVESDKKMIAEIAARNRAKLPTEESHDFGYGGH